MSAEPSSPSATTAVAAKPPPLTPYRGGPHPSDAASGGTGHGGLGRPLPVVGGIGAAGGRPYRGPAPPLWDQALEQEKRLRSELRKKSFWDPDVRRLRSALQGTYEALIFGHFEFSTAHEVEPCLWKAVFYKPIEEFRNRVRALEGLAKGAGAGGGGAAAGAAGAGGAAAVQLATPEEARAQLARTTSAYLRFLDDALAFYRKTVWKLQWVYGSVGAVVDLDAALQNEIQECVPRATGARVPDARPSVHRCLIYLGDLCRYQSMALKERPTSARPLWERAMSYYRQAARVLPASGNPYNQMAVMSYYTGDELRAVYYYFRSLAVAMPFVTARENLLLLFEKNRARYGNIAASHAAAALQSGPDADTRAAAGHLADVSVRFVRLHGLLFDRINIDTLPGVLDAAMKDLEGLLAHPGCRAILQRAHEADQLLFHLAILSVFAAHNQAAPPPGPGVTAGGGSYAAALQRAEQRSHALTVAMRFAAAVTGCTAGMAEAAAAGGGVGDVDTGFGAVSTACHVMLAWMVSNPAVLSAGPEAAGAAQPPAPPMVPGAGAGGAGVGWESSEVTAAEVAARAAFLLAASRLAAHLADLTRRRAHDQDWQDPAMRHRSLPEDSELEGFGPLAPVVSIASTWPAASEAPGGAAVLAVRVARMLQALRHIDDALGPARPASGPGPGAPSVGSSSSSALAAAARDLARAVQGFKAAMAAATAPHPQPQPRHPPPHPHAHPSQHPHRPHQHAPEAGAGPGPSGEPRPPHAAQRHPQQGHQQQPQPHPHYQNGGGPQPQTHQAHQHHHPAQHDGGARAGAPRAQLHQTPAAAAAAAGLGASSQGPHHLGSGHAAPAAAAAAPVAAVPASPLHRSVPQQLQGRGSGGAPAAVQPQPPPPYNGGGGGDCVAAGGRGGYAGGGEAAAAPPSPFTLQDIGAATGAGPLPQPHQPPPLPKTLQAIIGAAGDGGATSAPAWSDGAAIGERRMVSGDQIDAAALGSGGSGYQQQQGKAAGSGARAGAGGGGGGASAGDDAAEEDEIVYQPRRPGSALPRPVSIGAGMHRRSSSGGGGTGQLATSQEGRGLLSKQPSAGGSSTAAGSHLHSRETSRDGSTILLRSPSVLSTGEVHASGSAIASGAAVAAGPMPVPVPVPVGLTLPTSGGVSRLSSSGLTSPGSTYGNTVPPSPAPLHLVWDAFPSVSGSGGAGGGAAVGSGGAGSATGMAAAAGGVGGAIAVAAPPLGAGNLPARPPSPAVCELPGAGTIGLLQNLLHGSGAAGGSGGAVAVGTAGLMEPPAGRRLSTGAVGSAGVGASSGAPSATAGTITSGALSLLSVGTALQAAVGGSATGARPGSAAGAGTSARGPAAFPRRPSASLLQAAQGGGASGTAGGFAGSGSRSGGAAAVLGQYDTAPTVPHVGGDHAGAQPPQLLVAPEALAAPFVGLPASLQQRAQPAATAAGFQALHARQAFLQPGPQQHQHQQPHRAPGQLLLTAGLGTAPPSSSSSSPSAAALVAAAAAGGGGGLAPQPLLGFGAAAGNFVPGDAGGGVAGPPGLGFGPGQLGSGPFALGGHAQQHGQVHGRRLQQPDPQPQQQFGGWPDPAMSYFATAAGNYQAAALAEATAEATAVAMADDVLQAMDAEEAVGPGRGVGAMPGSAFARPAPGGGGPAGAGGAAGGPGTLSYSGGATEDFMGDTGDRFSPALNAAAAVGGPAGQSPVTREPSAASDGFFTTGSGTGTISGTVSGTVSANGMVTAGSGSGAVAAGGGAGGGAGSGAGGVLGGLFAARSSGSGSGMGLGLGYSSAAAAAAAAAGGVEGLLGTGPLPPPDMGPGHGPGLGSLEGFGSWGVVAMLPEQLTDYHQKLRRGATTGGSGGGVGGHLLGHGDHGASGMGAASLLGAGGGQVSNGGGRASAGGSAGAGTGAAGAGGVDGLFGEDLSCLSFLTAQLQRPPGGMAGAGDAQG